MKNRLFVAAMAAISILGTGIAAQDAGEEPTVEKLLQRLLVARGGAERWGEIKSLRIEGTWTAFSEDMPMTILRMRPNLYRFEHTVLGAPSILAFDGSKAWMQGAIYGAPDGQWIEDSWKRNVIEEAPFVCKLLDHAASGAGVELVDVGRRSTGNLVSRRRYLSGNETRLDDFRSLQRPRYRARDGDVLHGLPGRRRCQDPPP
jgi:hypothetical protein